MTPFNHRLAALLRNALLVLLLVCLGAPAFATQVSVTTVTPVADEASLIPADLQFQRDSTSGPLTVYFTISGTATQTVVPSFTLTSTAQLTMITPTTYTIVINNADSSEDLIVTPLDNHLITGDIQLLVTINYDPGNFYQVIGGPSAAQVDIAEGDVSSSVLVPAPIAYKNTALVGNAVDIGAPRRGILRTTFSPLDAYGVGATQIYVNTSTGPALAASAPISFASSSATTYLLSSAFTNAPGTITLATALTSPILIGDRVTSSATPTFSGQVGFNKALKVQFGGTAPLPNSQAGSATVSDVYSVTYKIGGSGMGSVTNPTSNGIGYNAVAYPIGSTQVFVTGGNQNLPMGSTIIFAGNSAISYTIQQAFPAGPGFLQIPAPGLLASVHDGDIVQLLGSNAFSASVTAPIMPGTTTLFVENGTGTLMRGDVFTLQGEDQLTCRYVITSTVPAVGVNGSGQISFRRYTGGTIGVDGVNNIHSFAGQESPSPLLSTIFTVTGDITDQANLASTGGIFQLLVPAESTLVDFGINPIDNGVVTGQLTVTMNLFADLNYAAITPTQGQVTIAESDSTASIQVTANAIQEPTQPACIPGTFVISLTNPFPQGVDVPVLFTTSTGVGQGVAGTDYQLLANSLTTSGNLNSVIIPAGQTQVTIQVIPSALAHLGSGKSVTLTLSPSDNFLLADTSGSLNASASMSLLPAPPPTPSLTITLGGTAVQPVSPGGAHTVGTFVVSSLTAVPNNLVVTYTLGGSAQTGIDYVSPAGYSISSGTITIPQGTTTASIPINPDISPLPGYNPSDIVTATLQIGSGSQYTLSTVKTASMTIKQSQIGVTAVTSTDSGSYFPGNVLSIAVAFSAPVNVHTTGMNPVSIQLALNTGVTNGIAQYQSASGSTIFFTYTVGVGDATAKLDYLSATSLTLGAFTTIVDASGNNGAVLLGLPTPPSATSLSGSTTITLDGRPAINITEIGSPAEYPVGAPTAAIFTITSSSPIPVGFPLTVNYTLGGNAVAGTDYVSPAGVGSVVLDSNNISKNVSILPIANPVYNPAEVVTATISSNAVYRLGTPPTASMTIAQSVIAALSVTTSNANATYTIGSQILLTVTFSAPVSITGAPPTLALNTGATNAVATYQNSPTPSTATFLYVVGVNDVSSHLDYLSTTALTGTFSDPSSNMLTVQTTLPAPGSAGSLSASSALVIDGAPLISFDAIHHVEPAEPSTSGYFIVTCTPAPAIPLSITYLLGGTAVIGTDYTSPSTFSGGVGHVTIPASVASSASVHIPIAPIANSVPNPNDTVIATITSGSGYHIATLSSDTLTIVQDSIGVVAVSSLDADGTYVYGQSLTITVTFGGSVLVSGTPLLALATGSTPAEATYASGSGTSTLNFTYVVGTNDSSPLLDYVNSASLVTNGGSVTSPSSQTVLLTLPTPGAAGSLESNKAIVIDGTLPAGKPTPGSITGPGAGSGGGCGLGSGFAALSAFLVLAMLRSLTRLASRRR